VLAHAAVPIAKTTSNSRPMVPTRRRSARRYQNRDLRKRSRRPGGHLSRCIGSTL